VTYTYDPLYRLSIATTTGSTGYPAWGLKNTYDRYGNRSDQKVNSGCTGITCPTNSFTPDPATNRISGDCYDANGNLLAESAPPCPSPTYTYDAENRLVNYMSANPTYVYDGKGLRVEKGLPNCTSPTSSTIYIFSGSKVIAEYDNVAPVGSPSREYIYAGGALLAKIDSSGTKYYHQDHLSNRLVTDSSGNTFAQMGHFPFGESWYNTTGDKLLFTTYERDSDSGNDYARARYDINRLGRFSSPDPLSGSTSDPQSLNLYDYVADDPTDLEDPSGLCPNWAPFGRDGKLICGIAGTGRKLLGYLIDWNPTAVFQVGGPEGPYVTDPSTCVLNANCRIIGPVFSGGDSSGYHWQLFPSSLRLPGESFKACVDRAQKALLGDTGQTVLNASTGVSLLTAIPTTSPAFFSSRGTTLAKAETIAGETVNKLGAQISADIIETTVVPKPSFVVGVINKSVASGTTLASDGAFFSTASGILSKASLITFAVGLGLEGGFAISCR
jgi:RHS repeat-associated protein